MSNLCVYEVLRMTRKKPRKISYEWYYLTIHVTYGKLRSE